MHACRQKQGQLVEVQGDAVRICKSFKKSLFALSNQETRELQTMRLATVKTEGAAEV
jgi:hypothetical protein